MAEEIRCRVASACADRDNGEISCTSAGSVGTAAVELDSLAFSLTAYLVAELFLVGAAFDLIGSDGEDSIDEASVTALTFFTGSEELYSVASVAAPQFYEVFSGLFKVIGAVLALYPAHTLVRVCVSSGKIG